MANPNTAAETLRNWAARYQDILELAALLEKLGSLDLVVSEAQTRASQAGIDEQLARSKLEDAQKQLDQVRGTIAALLEDAQVRVDAMQADGRLQAAALVDDATRKAAGIQEATELERDRVQASIEKQKADFATEFKAASVALDQVKADTDAATRELAALEAKIAKARETVAQLLGS